MWPFSEPIPAPPVITIRNRLAEEIDRVDGWNLERRDLRRRDWRHVDLRGLCLDGSDLSGTNALGADLRDASLRNCKLLPVTFRTQMQADAISGSDMVGCLIYRTETHLAKFRNVLLDEESDVR